VSKLKETKIPQWEELAFFLEIDFLHEQHTESALELSVIFLQLPYSNEAKF